MSSKLVSWCQVIFMTRFLTLVNCFLRIIFLLIQNWKIMPQPWRNTYPSYHMEEEKAFWHSDRVHFSIYVRINCCKLWSKFQWNVNEKRLQSHNKVKCQNVIKFPKTQICGHISLLVRTWSHTWCLDLNCFLHIRIWLEIEINFAYVYNLSSCSIYHSSCCSSF